MKIQYQDDKLVVFESSIFRTTSSLVTTDDYLVLVDPNWFPLELEFIASFIKKLNHHGEKFLLFTHSDYDHIIGYHKFNNYKTIASQNFVDNKDKQSVLDQITALDDDNYVNRGYEVVYPSIQLTITSEQEQKYLGKDNYTFHQARGHNKDGLIIYNEPKGILIVGDYLSNIEFPYVYDSFEFYKNTLNTLEKIITNQDVNILIPGHGDISYDKQDMLLRINESRNYIKELEYAVKENIEFDLPRLLAKYDFPQVMTKFHNKNISLLRREIGL